MFMNIQDLQKVKISKNIFDNSIFGLIIATSLIGLNAGQAEALQLALNGTYTGTVNGSSINATASGEINTDGPGGNLTATFTQIPSTFTPLAFGSSVVTVICWSSAEKSGNAQNLFDLSGGNYHLERTFNWTSIPNSTISVTGVSNTNRPLLQYSANFTGTYNGPLDISWVVDYQVKWTPFGDQVIEEGSAIMETSNGNLLSLEINTIYSGLSTPLLNSQVGRFSPVAIYDVNTGVFQATWEAEMRVVPEPTSIISLFSLGILGAGATIKRKVKRSHSTEKEAANVG
jgi:hypothetical protein